MLVTESVLYAIVGLGMEVLFYRRAQSALSRLRKTALATSGLGMLLCSRLITTAHSAGPAALFDQLLVVGFAICMMGLFQEAWRSPDR